MRTAFAARAYNKVFRRFVIHPRILSPVEQLFSGQVCVQQFKLNAKAAFSGDVWQWHHDFGVCHLDDEMPEPKAMNLKAYLDDVTEFNGPLYFRLKSHKRVVIDAGLYPSTTGYPLWTLSDDEIR